VSDMMNENIKIIKKLVHNSALVFLAFSILYLILYFLSPIEFADFNNKLLICEIISVGMPISIVLFFLNTLKRENKLYVNLSIFGGAMLLAFVCYIFLFLTVLNSKNWFTKKSLVKFENENAEIVQQISPGGSLDWNEYRTVKIKPILKYWIWVEEVDLNQFDSKTQELIDSSMNNGDES
jgi:hypothetical protein